MRKFKIAYVLSFTLLLIVLTIFYLGTLNSMVLDYWEIEGYWRGIRIVPTVAFGFPLIDFFLNRAAKALRK